VFFISRGENRYRIYSSVIAGLVPAIHRGANVICDRARRARFALHSCCTIDCRNKSGNDSIGCVEFSPSAQLGEYP
jgi:hypothetical protein